MSFQETHASQLPVPWRYVSRVTSDGDITYYQYPIKNLIPCLPPSKPNDLSQLVSHQARIIITAHSIPSLSSRKVLLIINPCAGSRSIQQPISLEPFLSILSEASLQHDLIQTQRSGHARSLISELYENDQLFQYDVIAPVGGDGTLHEVVNGLVDVLAKITQQSSKSLPTIAPVPGGTGNAVAHSMGLHTLQLAALNIIHGLRNLEQISKTLPLFQYYQLEQSQTQPNIISVCGVQWGLPADVDKGTLQWQNTIGEARYTLGVVSAILSKRVKKARIRVEVDPELQKSCWDGLLKQNDMLRRSNLLENGVTQVDESTYLLDGTFVQAVAWNWKDLAHGFQVTPLASLNETRVFDFMVFQSGLSRMKMIDLLLKVEDGSYINCLHGFRYFKAKKITFESIEGDFLTVDGESVPVEPCVMQVSQYTGKLNILDGFSEPDQQIEKSG